MIPASRCTSWKKIGKEAESAKELLARIQRERERRWKRFLVNKLLYAKAWENSILERKREKEKKNGKSKAAEDRE